MSPQEFGKYLRHERELREVSREQLSAAVKVSVRQIEALETGRFEHLPAIVFVRGFVRSIALHLKLDPEKLMQDFRGAHDSWTLTERARTAERELTISGSVPRLSEPRRTVSAQTTLRGLAVAAVLALLTGGAAILKTKSGERAAPSVSAANAAAQPQRALEGPASLALPPAIAEATVALPPEEAAVSERKLAPVAAAANQVTPSSPVTVEATAQESPGGGAGGIRLTLTFQDDCWTEVHADGKLIAAELFRKGSSREFSGSKRFTLTLGNAGGVGVTVDGKALQPFGAKNQVVRNIVIGQESRSGRG